MSENVVTGIVDFNIIMAGLMAIDIIQIGIDLDLVATARGCLEAFTRFCCVSGH